MKAEANSSVLNKKEVDVLCREVLIQQLQRLHSPRQRNACCSQPSRSRPKHALCKQKATATAFLLRPPARKQMGVLGFGALLWKAQTRERKKKNPACSLPLKVKQEEKYTMSFSPSKGSSYDCKTSVIAQGLFHEVSQGHSSLQNQQKGGTARILPYCHDWLAELAVRGKPACCSHYSQHCLKLQTGRLWGSMAESWLTGPEYGLSYQCHVAHVGFRN